MTLPSRHFTAAPRDQRGSLARFGTIGSMMLWAATLAGTPFYVIIALVFGVSYSIVDRVRAAGRAGSDAVERALSGATPVTDGLGALIDRLRAGADGALQPWIERRKDRLVISLPRQDAFTEGDAIPTSGARALLARLAHAVENGSWRIDVIGYGDSASIGQVERADSAALELSSRRAQAAAETLRLAGCRWPIAALGASAANRSLRESSPDEVEREPSALEIVIRGSMRGNRDAA